jgi:Coenzyme PQQ synthesis protein D (PqqD)
MLAAIEPAAADRGAMQAYVVNRGSATWRVVDDEAVIVHAETSEYFSLNQSGTWVWGLLEAPRSVADLAAAVGARYGRDAAATVPDLEAFVAHLERAGLLLPTASAPVAHATADPSPGGDPYEPPQLVKFGDLETLILSGE